MSEKKIAEREKDSEKNSKINRKKLIIAIVLAIALVLIAYAAYAGSYAKVYPNTYINGEALGGLTYDEVVAKIDESAKNTKIPDAIEFSLEGEKFSVSSSEIGLKPDSEKTAQWAMGTDGNFFVRIVNYSKSLFSEKQIYTAFSYDSKKLNRAISDFAAPYETEAIDASYELDGNKLILRKGHDGIKVSKKTLKEDISKYIKSPTAPVALTLAKKATKEFDLEELYKELTSDATDAYYTRNENGEIIVVPDKPKVKVDKSALKSALDADKEVTTLTVTAIPAKTTKAALTDALFCGTMGSWTSYFSASNRPRSANVALSAERIDGVVLLPGESFSYDKTVGPRTTANGFKIAGVYINNKVEEGVGGGICQTSSTLYSAVLYSNLEIVSRTSHSLPVSYMPPGQDATIAEGAIDFVFRNNTAYPVKISATISGGSVTCKIIGTPVEGQKVVVNNTITAVYEPKIEVETDASIPKGYKKTVIGSKGNAVSSTRTVYQDGKVVKTERLTKSVYNATPTVITVNPEDKDTPPESLTEFNAAEEITPPEIIEQEGEAPTPTPAPTPEEEIVEI